MVIATDVYSAIDIDVTLHYFDFHRDHSIIAHSIIAVITVAES